MKKQRLGSENVMMARLLWCLMGTWLLSVWLIPKAVADDGAYQPVVGEPHPEILLPRIDSREPVALSQFRGKKVLLIHFASW